MPYIIQIYQSEKHNTFFCYIISLQFLFKNFKFILNHFWTNFNDGLGFIQQISNYLKKNWTSESGSFSYFSTRGGRYLLE